MHGADRIHSSTILNWTWANNYLQKFPLKFLIVAICKMFTALCMVKIQNISNGTLNHFVIWINICSCRSYHTRTNLRRMLTLHLPWFGPKGILTITCIFIFMSFKQFPDIWLSAYFKILHFLLDQSKLSLYIFLWRNYLKKHNSRQMTYACHFTHLYFHHCMQAIDKLYSYLCSNTENSIMVLLLCLPSAEKCLL